MTLYRLAAFSNHWMEYPPLHTSFAGFIRGLGGKKNKQGQVQDDPNERPPSRPGFPDRPPQRKGTPVPPVHIDMPARDAMDAHSPVFRAGMERAGATIHHIKRRSPIDKNIKVE